MKGIKIIMKRLTILLACLIGITSFVSCSKDDDEGGADAFVGYYNVSVIENVVWGGTSGTLNDSGVMSISKISDNKVKVEGYISTIGEVVGNLIYFESSSSSDSSGYLTISYGVGTLNGNVLTFTANQTGQLASNGVMFPFRCSASFTAIKQ